MVFSILILFLDGNDCKNTQVSKFVLSYNVIINVHTQLYSATGVNTRFILVYAFLNDQL